MSIAYRCDKAGKVIFDKKGARTAANKRYEEDHERLDIYPCGNHWHLTSRLKKRFYED